MTELDYTLNTIKVYLKERGYTATPYSDGFLIDIDVAGTSHQIRAVVPESYPFTLPKFHLVNRLNYGALAHIGWNTQNPNYGDICYFSSEHNSIDTSQAKEIFVFALEQAIEILRKALTDCDENDSEIEREYMAVWAFHSNRSHRLWCLAEPLSDDIIELDIFKGDENRDLAISSHNKFNVNTMLNPKRMSKGKQLGKGVLLKVDKLIPVPAPKESFMDWWRRQYALLPVGIKDRLRECFGKVKSKSFTIVFCSHIHGNPIYVGLKFTVSGQDKNTKLSCPISLDKLEGWEVISQDIRPFSPDVLIPRGGGIATFQGKHICIVGVGSVGSHVAEMLCGEGVGQITLIDNEILEPANIHKHVLGAGEIGYFKGVGLKIILETNYPFVQINAKVQAVSGLDFSQPVNWRRFDLIIWATGNLTLEKAFSTYAIEQSINVPIVHGWNEPFGVGGHVVVTTSESSGCLSCLYIDKKTLKKSLYHNLSFIKPGQKVLSEIGGCGFDYLAFSKTDAIQTATLMSRMAKRVLTGNVTESVAMSWKGDSFDADLREVELTGRYNSLSNNIKEIKLKNEDCDACN